MVVDNVHCTYLGRGGLPRGLTLGRRLHGPARVGRPQVGHRADDLIGGRVCDVKGGAVGGGGPLAGHQRPVPQQRQPADTGLMDLVGRRRQMPRMEQ